MSANFAVQDGADRPAAPSRRAIFVDKDGTLVEDIPDNVDPERLRFTPRALEGLALLAARGYLIVVVTEQPGLAYNRYTRAQLTRLRLALAELMQRDGVPLADFYACTHAPGPARPVPACLCRKPAPGLLRQAARAHGIDLTRSWMVGDLLDDVEAGRRAGCRSILLDVGHETAWRLSPLRTPHARAADLLEAAQHIMAADDAPASAAPDAEPEPPGTAPTLDATVGPLRRSVAQAAGALQAAISRAGLQSGRSA